MLLLLVPRLVVQPRLPVGIEIPWNVARAGRLGLIIVGISHKHSAKL